MKLNKMKLNTIKVTLLIAILILSAISVIAPTVQAIPIPVVSDYDTVITKAADRLVALQGTDGGWDWDITGLTAHSGTYPSPVNLFGVTALGLIDAYQITSDSSY